MAVVGAKPFAVRTEPGADYLIFGAGEENVAVFAVSTRGMGVRNEKSLWGFMPR